MANIIRIDVDGCEPMYADLLTKLAPETCAAFCADLPYRDKIISHVKWSGNVISVFSTMAFSHAEATRCLGVVPGDILYNPHVHDAAEHPNEVSLVYGPAAMRTFSGYALANRFAKVRPEYLAALSELGNDINRHGERTASFMLVEE